MTERVRQRFQAKKREQYTLAEDTAIVARTIINVVLSTRQDVDPHPFVVALLEGYAERIQADQHKGEYQYPEQQGTSHLLKEGE